MFDLGRRLSRLMIVFPVAAMIALTPSVAHAAPLLTEFSQPTGYDASEPIAGPDGDVWFLNGNAGIGVVSPAGAFTEINFGTPMTSTFLSIAAGAGNSIWVGDSGLHAIWRIIPGAPAGQQVTEGKTRIRTVTVVTYSAKATARRLPVTERLSLRGLRSGTHTLTVRVAYHEIRTETIRRHGKRVKIRRTVTVTRNLKPKLAIC